MDIVVTCDNCGRQLDTDVSLLQNTQVELRVELCPDCIKEVAAAAEASE